jgi:cytochrome c556
MLRKTIIAVLALAGLSAVAVPLSAQVRPDVLVQQRQAAMVLKGKYFYGHLRPMAQGKIPYEAALVARDIAFLDALARMPWDGFAPATKGVKSGATPAVFTEAGKFKEAQESYLAEVAKLSALANKGDEPALRAQILTVNKSCAGCHDAFRERR